MRIMWTERRVRRKSVSAGDESSGNWNWNIDKTANIEEWKLLWRKKDARAVGYRRDRDRDRVAR